MIWRPDTCGCVLEYSDDGRGNVPENLVRVLRACPAHPVLSAHAVMAENQTKNYTLGQLALRAPALTRRVTDASGQPGDVIDESKVAWRFDAQRQLVIDAPSLTAAEKAALETALAGDVSRFQPNASAPTPAVIVP